MPPMSCQVYWMGSDSSMFYKRFRKSLILLIVKYIALFNYPKRTAVYGMATLVAVEELGLGVNLGARLISVQRGLI